MAQAQPARPARVGLIHAGGSYHEVVDGLLAGMKELALGAPQVTLEVRDLKGAIDAAEAVAKRLESDKVNLIYVVTTSVATRAVRATTQVPMVFVVGRDPVESGLVKSFAQPGGRLTGVYYPSIDLTAKRLELLKEMVPGLRRALTFYSPTNPSAVASLALARETARQLKLEIVVRQVRSVEELRLALAGVDAKQVGGYFHGSDVFVTSHSQLIAETLRAKKIPSMFHHHAAVEEGGLAGYGVSFHEAGRLSARYVQRILAGASPRDMAVETVSRIGLSINLNTAREIGLAIPTSIRLRADRIVE